MLVIKGLGMAPLVGGATTVCTLFDPTTIDGRCLQQSAFPPVTGGGGGTTPPQQGTPTLSLSRVVSQYKQPATLVPVMPSANPGGLTIATPLPIFPPPDPAGQPGPQPPSTQLPPPNGNGGSPGSQPPPPGLPGQDLGPGVRLTPEEPTAADNEGYLSTLAKRQYFGVSLGKLVLLTAGIVAAGAGVGVLISRRRRAA